MTNINTILFDLDGTLLPLETDYFIKLYFKALNTRFADMYSPQEMEKLIWDATDVMVKHRDYVTNKTVFMNALGSMVNGKLPEMQRRFDLFYEQDFDAVKGSVHESREMREAIGLLKFKGYTLAIATNPIFPKTALAKRIEWTGIKRENFVHVSSFEESHYCKPHHEFYLEILDRVGKQPSECLMVGNDAFEDMIASELNIKTYLITNHLIDRKQKKFPPDHQGQYPDFLSFVNGLPALK
jgi:FMN phosphatase YigB (HAD superfamily)